MSNIQGGNSNSITRQYLDSLLIETRYIDSTNPTTDFELFGEQFATPIMTGALSHIGTEAGTALAEGARDAGAVLWYGMANEEEIELYAATGAKMIEIIKPYKDREIIYRKIEHAEKLGLLAVGIDIDHPFAKDGSPDVVSGYELSALTQEELTDICKSTKLPLILKGVLSVQDAKKGLAAGAGGLLLSHHNNRISYAVPPVMLLPQILALTGNQVPVFVDGEITTGMDAFKALALGAKGVGVGRPLLAAAKENGAEGVKAAIEKMTGELRQAMAYTGCIDLSRMDASVIHPTAF